MKRLSVFAALIICVMAISGCKKNDDARFFDYQEGKIELDCVLVYNGHENNVKISASEKNEKGEREYVSVKYETPEIIGGYVLEKSGGQYVGKMGEVEIPFGETVVGAVKYVETAFDLSEDMISQITSSENGMTEATVLSEEVSGKVIIDKKGHLSHLELSFADGKTLGISKKSASAKDTEAET